MGHKITHDDGTVQDITCDKVALIPVVEKLVMRAAAAHLEVDVIWIWESKCEK
jgi:hypothetical protein